MVFFVFNFFFSFNLFFLGPDFSDCVYLPNGVQIPMGDVKDYEYSEEDKKKVVLSYNEYIVYQTDQIRMRYLVQVTKKK